MQKQILQTISILLLLAGCKAKTGTNEHTQNHIRITEQKAPSTFNDYFTLETILPIETNDDCLIDRIRRIILQDDKLFILNGNTEVIAINSHTGKYISHLRKTGNGPGEYSKIRDIAFHENKNLLIIYSDSKKLLVYDTDFNFQEEIYVGDRSFEEFTCLNDTIYFFNPIPETNKNIIVIYELHKRKWKEETGDRNYNDKYNMRGDGTSLVKNRSIWYTSPFRSTLSRIEHGQITKVYDLNIYNYGHTEELVKLQNDFREFLDYVNREKICYSLTAPREIGEHIYLKSNRHALLIIDKTTNQVTPFNYGTLTDNSHGFTDLNYFPHDGSDDTLLFILPPKTDEESNPILLFYKPIN